MAQRGERTENLPILQDFVPYRGRCPASQRKIYGNKEKQGKGIADHLMPLGDWFLMHYVRTDGPTDGPTDKASYRVAFRN